MSLPADDSAIYLADISLQNLFDGKEFELDRDFWKNGAHSALGEYINWPLGECGICCTLRQQVCNPPSDPCLVLCGLW